MIKKWYIDLIKNKKQSRWQHTKALPIQFVNYSQRFDFAQRLWPDPSTTLRILVMYLSYGVKRYSFDCAQDKTLLFSIALLLRSGHNAVNYYYRLGYPLNLFKDVGVSVWV